MMKNILDNKEMDLEALEIVAGGTVNGTASADQVSVQSTNSAQTTHPQVTKQNTSKILNDIMRRSVARLFK